MNNSHRTSRLFALLPLALMAGFADRPVTAPVNPDSGATHMAAAPAPTRPKLVSGSVKYREQKHKHATGRAGSAELKARALADKHGKITLELTTGELDKPETARGTISKVQAKLFDPNGELRATYNFNGLRNRGTWTQEIPGWVPGSVVQLQANVQGIDAGRTGVVTLRERVNRRPDLAIVGVTAASRVPVNTTTSVRVSVAEKNGDVGAHALCKLYVDGKLNDQWSPIWVAESDAVECAFRPSFTAPGRHQLLLRVEDVRPGDWEDTNNETTATVEVVRESQPVDARLVGVLNAAEVVDSVADQSYYRFLNVDGAGGWEESGSEEVHGYRTQSASFYGSAPVGAVNFPVDAVKVVFSSGGRALGSVSGMSVAYSHTIQETGEQCGEGYPDGKLLEITVCSGPSGVRVEIHRNQEDVTYYARSYYKWWGLYGEGAEYYPAASMPGTLTSFASDYRMDVRIDDNGSVFQASPATPLVASATAWRDLWRDCYSDPTLEVCSVRKQMTSRLQGSASF